MADFAIFNGENVLTVYADGQALAVPLNPTQRYRLAMRLLESLSKEVQCSPTAAPASPSKSETSP